MNRRSFLMGLGAVVGGVALDQAVPLGRVWSFPTQIRLAKPTEYFIRPSMLLVPGDIISIDHEAQMLYRVVAVTQGSKYKLEYVIQGEPHNVHIHE